jgi:hypothetical protein
MGAVVYLATPSHAEQLGSDNQTLDEWAAKVRASLEGFVAAMGASSWEQSERDLSELFAVGFTVAPAWWPEYVASVDADTAGEGWH